MRLLRFLAVTLIFLLPWQATASLPTGGTHVASQERELSHVAGGPSSTTRRPACRTSGQYDSHILAITWHPGFCEVTASRRTECETLDESRYESAHFTLHGLWPNKRSCGTGYGYCGAVRETPRNFCHYPELDLADEVRKNLERAMPSAKHGTCLQRHEWWKHGTCRNGDPDQYFTLAIRLLNEINESSFVTDFMHRNIGNTVRRDDVLQAFDRAFGVHAHRHIALICTRGILTEIRVSLPKNLNGNTPIRQWLATRIPARSGTCGSTFHIDAAGPQS